MLLRIKTLRMKNQNFIEHKVVVGLKDAIELAHLMIGGESSPSMSSEFLFE